MYLLDGKVSGEGGEAADPADQPGAVGLRDSAFAADAQAERGGAVRCGQCGVCAVVAGPPAAGGRRGGVRAVCRNAGCRRCWSGMARRLSTGLVALTSERHKKYGDTLFHLEPSIKDCPGGLRDVHVCAWLKTLASKTPGEAGRDSGSGWAGRRQRRVSRRRWSFCSRCGVFCTTGMSATTTRWTGRRRMRRRRQLIGPTGSGRHAERSHGRCGVLDAALLPPCADRGADA